MYAQSNPGNHFCQNMMTVAANSIHYNSQDEVSKLKVDKLELLKQKVGYHMLLYHINLSRKMLIFV